MESRSRSGALAGPSGKSAADPYRYCPSRRQIPFKSTICTSSGRVARQRAPVVAAAATTVQTIPFPTGPLEVLAGYADSSDELEFSLKGATR